MAKIRGVVIALIVFAFLSSIVAFSGCKPKEKPLNVIIVWHNHQPFYKNPVSQEYILPWVRLHGVKDYYRMPYIVSQHPDIKVSFDLSGSLIAQLNDYIKGAKDERELLSEKSARKLTQQDKWKMLQIPGGFFDINWDHILKKVPMYSKILDERQEIFKKFSNLPESERIKKITSSLPDQYYLNLAALFNLFWMDSDYVRNNDTLKLLYNKAFNGENYTLQNINTIMNAQLEILKKIFPEYKELLDKKQIELVTTPYTHPISALLTDFGWNNDLTLQIDKANDLFRQAFGTTPKGVWASECAINDEALKLFSKAGWEWTISDTDNLSQLGIDTVKNPLAKFKSYEADGVTVFFRDKYLSDGIGFRYSGKSVQDAVDDFTNALLKVQKENTSGNLVYTIALDGENAWEYYNNDGNDFLNTLYEKLSDLQKEGKIKTITPSEYIEKFGKGGEITVHTVEVLDLKDKDISNATRYSALPKKKIQGAFGESSWVNPTLDTWIGEKQENIAWEWLSDARKVAKSKMDSLTEGQKDSLMDNLMRAEGSDWFWWYGSDQDSGNDQSFDRLFKMYLYKIYKIVDAPVPGYLFGNYFPDGTPYLSIVVNLEKNKYANMPVIQEDVQIKLLYDGKNIKAEIHQDSPLVVMGVFDGENEKNPFFIESKQPDKFDMNPFPYDASNIGIPLDIKLISYNKNDSVNTSKLILNVEQLADKNNIFIAFAGGEKGKTLIPYTIPIHVKIPLEVKGSIVGELLDDEGDDNGPGTYKYPLADVFKQAGRNLFDLVSFKMIDSGKNYVLQYQMGNLGGNPWNGPNGISLQIIETYIDFKSGGKTDTIAKGPNVQFSKDHPWDIALRVAGWSYGNFIALSDGTSIQGELYMQIDQKKNLITVSFPKKYMQILKDYKPYIAIISGSQDGYGEGYWRKVNVTASEWQGGGADPDAFNVDIAPNVYDIFVPKDGNQGKIFSSYDAKNKTFAIIPMLPLEKIKPVPKITGQIIISAPKIISPGDKVLVKCQLKNIGKGVQKDDPNSDELTIQIPSNTKLLSFDTPNGDVRIKNNILTWNGMFPVGIVREVSLTLQTNKDIANDTVIKMQGTINYDSNGDGKNDTQALLTNSFTVKYPVTLIIPLNSNTFIRNEKEIPISGKEVKAEYKEEWNDVAAPIQRVVEALGGEYTFDTGKKKIIITFIGNKYEHWIGQNKSLLNGNAIPLYPGNPDVKSYIENGVPILPLKSIAYAFKLKYNFVKGKSVVQMQYSP